MITVSETIVFTRQAADVWRDNEHEEFVNYISANPEGGSIIPDTGGVRKIRWSRQGVGKRGGVRVIYYYHDPDMPLHLLMIYAKAKKENMTVEDKRAARAFVDTIKNGFKRRLQ